MNDTLMGWYSKIVIAIFPIVLALVSVGFGNSIANAIIEGLATFLYLLVLFSSENAIRTYINKDENPREGFMWFMILVFMFSFGLWFFFYFARALTGYATEGIIWYYIIIIGAFSLLISYWVIKNHRLLTSDYVANKIGENKERLRKSVDTSPKDVDLGGTKIELE